MWKTSLPSKVRAHKVAALTLILVAAVSATVVVYRFTSFTSFTMFLGAPCPLSTKPFQADNMPPGTVYQVSPPGRITVCYTVQISGRVPVEGVSNVPGIGLHNSKGTYYAACGYADCGGVSASASPARAFSDWPVHVVATIDVPVGSTRGDYWVIFGPGCTTAVLSLRIGETGQTIPAIPSPAFACPIPLYGVGVTFNGYAGMNPIAENATGPVFL